MAKTVAVTEILPPTNLAASLVADGSLVAGTTYYYRMVAVEMTGSNGRVDSCYAISAPSAEVSATCDAANKSIKLDWTATTKLKVSGYLGYLVYRTTTSGDYSAATAKLIAGPSGEGGYPTIPATTVITFTDTGTRALFTSLLPALGCPLVEIDGGTSSDYVDEEFIYQGFVTAGKTAFCFKNSIVSDGKGAQYFFNGFFRMGFISQLYWKINSGRAMYIEGRIQCASNSELRMGSTSGNGAILGVAGALGDCQSVLGGSLYIFNSKIIDLHSSMGITNIAGGGYFKPAASLGQITGSSGIQGTLKNTQIFTYGSNNQFTGDLYIDNCVVETNPRFEVVAAKVPSFVGVAFSGGTNSLYTYGAYYVRVVNCSMLQTTREFQFHGVNTYKRVIDLINFTSANTPIKSASITNPEYGWYLRRWSFNATIVDQFNNPVQNALISIKDKNGYSSVFVDSTATFSAISSATTTSVTVSNGALFSIGEVIKVCAENMLITNISGNVLTVTRGYQGTLTNIWASCDYRVWKQQESVATDATGKIPEQYLLAETYQGKSTGTDPYKYDTVVYTPHTITVKKSGYKGYTDTLTVSEPITLKLKLQKVLNNNFSNLVKIQTQ